MTRPTIKSEQTEGRVAPPSSSTADEARASAERMFQMLRDAGTQDIDELDPAKYPPPDAAFLKALGHFETLIKVQVNLLDRFEAVCRRMEAQQAAKSAPRPRPEPGVIETPRHDVGNVWAQGLTSKPIGSE